VARLWSFTVKIPQSIPLLVAILTVTEGCFHYVPEGDIALTRGTPIRLHLERPASFELTRVTVNSVITVNGEMVRREAGDVILSATWLDASIGDGFPGDGSTLRIPEINVNKLEVKRFSWWRTGIVVLGGALGTFLGFDLLGTGSEGSGGSGGGANAL
jgi:hypothetical protein